jgi:TonB dependent receptor
MRKGNPASHYFATDCIQAPSPFECSSITILVFIILAPVARYSCRDADASSAHSCTKSIAIVGRYIPNSPTNVIDAGLTAQRSSGWFGAIRARHFGESPLVEDDSERSPAYTAVDLQFGFKKPQWLAAVDVFNVFDVKWNDIEYYHVSRLRNEATPQADFVVHSGVPLTVRLHFQYSL